jgi:Lar family restriction alleviation protein
MTKADVEGLLPCPFCGGKPVMEADNNHWMLICDNGECAGHPLVIMGKGGAKSAAIAAWNRRAPATPAPQGEREITRENLCNCGALEAFLAGHKPWCAFVAAVAKQKERETDEKGWLAELRSGVLDQGGPSWWEINPQIEDGGWWTKDASKALRFARKIDAENFIADIGWTDVSAVEHMWPDVPIHDPISKSALDFPDVDE